MKINWKVRIKNPVFWMTIIPSAATFIYTLLACFGITPAISETVMVNMLASLVSALSTLGVLVDPTTKGVSDGSLGITYDTPQ